jgi:pimeloyl-ACP methyl ester carboxylesterase
MQIIANGLQIEVDIQGPEHGEPILLIMGLGMQLIGWPDELVQMLVQRGFRVIRHDNRDVGLSQGFDRLGVPNVMVEVLRHRLRLGVRAPYQIADMAADALGVLDALGIEHAHICGASMGGMIAQHIAAKHPRRVRSLTLIMTTSGARSLKQAHPKVLRVLMSRPQRPDLQAFMAHNANVLSVIGSPGYPPDPQRLQQRLMASFSRAYRPAGTARQLVAVAADAGDPWRSRPAGAGACRARPGAEDSRCRGGHRARHGPRPAAATAAAHRRRHRAKRLTQHGLKAHQAVTTPRARSLRSSSAHSTPLASSSNGPSTWSGSGTVWNSAFIGGA